jgi:MoaA/NifB/PqqE/SkfB family radical SAM enzyme
MTTHFLVLSNYGLRLLFHEAQTRSADMIARDPVLGPMAAIFTHGRSPLREVSLADHLFEMGLVTRVDASVDDAAVRLRYARNPLEHVTRLVFEFTRRCNFRCKHCRNAGVREAPERRTTATLEAVDAMAAIGVRRFDFIGGEVTKFGDGWLDVVRRASRVKGATVGVVTNGWFLEEECFEAAGEPYPDDVSYLRGLGNQGVTHMIFSLDGPAAVHDRWRRKPGLHARILRSFDRVREAGLVPRVSLVLRKGESREWLEPVARAAYPTASSAAEAMTLLFQDDTNYVSNFIDVGAGAQLRREGFRLDDVPDDLLRCKSYFRPSPSLRIQANGELSTCPLLDAGEGYGNVSERGLVSVLNGMQDAFVYRLHADNRIARYRHLVSPDWFGDRVEHVCSVRAALTLIARGLDEQGIDPGDERAAQRVVEHVAERTRCTA